MKRICIIGGSGTGKTTLSNNLSKELNLPVYHIDGIHHLENWKKRDKEERDRLILERASEEKWIIDGTYHSTLQQRLEKADYVIYLDYSTMAQVIGVLKRFIKNHKKLSIFIGLILLFSLSLGGTILALNITNPPEVNIPNVVGMAKDEAQREIENEKLRS